MNTLSDYRTQGRSRLADRWNEAAMLTFVYLLIAGAGSTCLSGLDLIARGAGSACYILLLPLSWSYSVAFLDNHQGASNDPFNIERLFDGYRQGQFFRIFTTMLLTTVYTLLWTLQLIIPGIIKALSYALTPYILRDNPQLSGNQAIELSMHMMKGHKWQLFCLCLSFLGWFLLCLCTLFIGVFWLQPYVQSTLASFYEDRRTGYEQEGCYQK